MNCKRKDLDYIWYISVAYHEAIIRLILRRYEIVAIFLSEKNN
jgi:hypothetical protein